MTAIMSAAKPSISGDFADRRITTGAKIFRALLAADVDIGQKAGSDGSLKLCLLYTDDPRNAEIATATLLNRDDTRIRKIDVSVEAVAFSAFVEEQSRPIAGIYLTQLLSADQLELLLKLSIEQHIIIFSPFEGDVERGVHSGLAVEARVRPYLNMKALQTAGIRLKSFFMRVAKQYEE